MRRNPFGRNICEPTSLYGAETCPSHAESRIEGSYRTNEAERRVRPPEALETRLLLYSKLGDQWTYDSRITYSFMPDGTNIGGVPSVLFQTLNQNNSTSAWQQQIKDAASLWENSSNINLALVSDGGQAVGTSGNQQDDPRFGDIRIGAIPLGPGVLAETFLPPPANGGTDAGDIILNSSINWQINNNYDVMTVMAHEFGHALGLGDSTVSGSVMYGTYSGIDQSLSSDDQSGIQSVYGARQFDMYNNAGKPTTLISRQPTSTPQSIVARRSRSRASTSPRRGIPSGSMSTFPPTRRDQCPCRCNQAT